MWIITHDNVHEAGTNPARNVPRSKDYLSRMSRMKRAERKHVFRLMHKGREMFCGVAYFENDASFHYVLRPLDEFGRSEYDCDEIQYMIRDVNGMTGTPNGKSTWNRIHEEGGREIDRLIADGKIRSMGCLLTEINADSVCELSATDVNETLVAYGG